MKIKALVLDDDTLVRGVFSTFFKMSGSIVEFTNSVHTTLIRCAEQRFDLVLLDYNITATEAGWSVAPLLRMNPTAYGSPKILLMSGTVTLDAIHEIGVPRECFDTYQAKPFSLKELDEQIHRLFPNGAPSS